MIRLVLVALLLASSAQAQEQTPIEYGCWFSFVSEQCFEAEETLWYNFGHESNIAVYGAPIGKLLNNAIEWHEWAQHLQKRLDYQREQKRFYRERLLKLRRNVWRKKGK